MAIHFYGFTCVLIIWKGNFLVFLTFFLCFSFFFRSSFTLFIPCMHNITFLCCRRLNGEKYIVLDDAQFRGGRKAKRETRVREMKTTRTIEFNLLDFSLFVRFTFNRFLLLILLYFFPSSSS